MRIPVCDARSIPRSSTRLHSFPLGPGILETPRRDPRARPELLREQRDAEFLEHPAELVRAGRPQSAFSPDSLAVTGFERRDLRGELRVATGITGQLLEPLLDRLQIARVFLQPLP